MRCHGNPCYRVLATFFAILAGPASAHPAEQGFVLLLPTDVYVTAGTLTVVASIVLVTCLPRAVLSRLFPPLSLGADVPKLLASVQNATSLLASLFLLLLVYIGFYGPSDPQNNLMPLTIWTVWWTGLFVVQGLVFDVWTWVNPWTGFARFFGLGEAPLLRLPARLKAWPAVVLVVLFHLFLLADVAPNDPTRLTTIVLSYWVFTLAGIELFGRDAWLSRVECFTVMFRLIGTLRPLQDGRLGFPGWHALARDPLDLSLAAFCLIVLIGGSFDGLNETFWWLAQVGINPLAFPGRSAVVWSSTWGLVGAMVVLFVLFGAAVWVGLKAVHWRGKSDRIAFGDAFKMFAVTLLPIALGYHFAHYLVSFMVQIKVTLSTASDPLALGWNLFGLGAVRANVGFLTVPETVKVIWITQASVVVFSHVVSVVMAHHIAHKLCRNNKDVVLIQIGLTALMIAYTVFGLWLLASPRGA